jgi:uncharacterized protein
MIEVFLDTSYAISLAVVSDQLHPQALALAQQLRNDKTRLIVTRAVMLEIGNSLSKARYRNAAIALLNALEVDPLVEIVDLNLEDYQTAFALFQQRSDKEWGLVDCISFVIMKQRGLYEALTADGHFVQAGFRALLLEHVQEGS